MEVEKPEKIPGDGKNFDEIPWEEKKKNMEKFQGVEKALIEFQVNTVSEMDIFNRYGLFLEKPIFSCINFRKNLEFSLAKKPFHLNSRSKNLTLVHEKRHNLKCSFSETLSDGNLSEYRLFLSSMLC